MAKRMTEAMTRAHTSRHSRDTYTHPGTNCYRFTYPGETRQSGGLAFYARAPPGAEDGTPCTRTPGDTAEGRHYATPGREDARRAQARGRGDREAGTQHKEWDTAKGESTKIRPGSTPGQGGGRKIENPRTKYEGAGRSCGEAGEGGRRGRVRTKGTIRRGGDRPNQGLTPAQGDSHETRKGGGWPS